MNGTQKLEQALKAYADRFDNLDELTHPQLMEDPRFPDFVQAAVRSGEKITREQIEQKFGAVAWDW